jgi:photosystem II stability/assembly factor-like uncharacterized protein
MKRRLLFLLLIVAVAASLIALIALTSRASRNAVAGGPPRTEEAEEESPGEAERWEWMRLHDPATGTIPRDMARREGAFARTLPVRPPGESKGGGRSIASLPWEFRGPVNVGGRTRALAVDVSDTNALLAGAATGGMWRSPNGGKSWSRRTPLDAYPGVTCLTQDTRPGHTDTWYYGTGEFRTNSTRFGNTGFPGDGIYKSTDRGLTWGQLPATANPTPQSLDRPFDFVSTIVIDRSNLAQDELYAAVYGSIMRSTDGGATWSATLGGIDNPTGYSAVAITDSGVLYAGLGSGGNVHGIYRSTNGIDWTAITPPNWGDSCKRIVIEVGDGSTIHILAETEGRGHLVSGSYGYPEYYSLWRYTYMNSDGSGKGGVWIDLSDNLPSQPGPWEYNGLGSYALLLRTDMGDSSRIWIGGSNLYRSDDRFTTSHTEWMGGYGEDGSWGGPGTLHPDQHAMAFNPLNPKTLYVGNDGGIYRTRSADRAQPTWEALSNSYITSQFYTVAVDMNTPGSELMMGGAQDNGTWITDTRSAAVAWNTPFGGDGAFCAIANHGDDIYFSSQNANIFRQNITTNIYTKIDPLGASDYLFVAPFALDPLDENVMYLAGGRTLWRNDDLSQIPSSIFEPTTVNWNELVPTASTAQISAIGVSTAAPAHRVYYGTTDGRLYRLDDALSNNSVPAEITGAAFPAGAYINCVAVDPADGDRALAVFTNYGVQSLFFTTDGGATWSGVGGNLEEFPDGSGSGPSCRWAAFAHHGSNSRIFVGTSVGLYSASALDGAATVWEQEGASVIGNVRVDMIQSRPGDGLIAVATWGRGIYSTQLPLAGVEDGGAVADLSLEGAWPNPARDRATIRFTLPAGGATRLALFDPLGREVARLLDARLEAGAHEATLDLATIPPAALPNGAYFYRLECRGRIVTRGMIVER